MGQADGTVTILMAVRNGAGFLPAQLRSIASQSHSAWRLWASDDGSVDRSPEILSAFAGHGHEVRLWPGPRKGAAANFLSLARRIEPESAGWVGFADQDDVWLPDRLSRGIGALRALPRHRPALYCSRSWIVDCALKDARLSPPRPHGPSFRNALLQNIAAGNTILLNPAAARLAAVAARRVGPVPMHDWWLYQLITGVGGAVIHDDMPTILYRQHGQNVMGTGRGWRARAARLGLLGSGQYRVWNRQNLAALHAMRLWLTPENREILNRFDAACAGGPLRMQRAIRHLGLYRQSRAETAAMWCAAGLGRL